MGQFIFNYFSPCRITRCLTDIRTVPIHLSDIKNYEFNINIDHFTSFFLSNLTLPIRWGHRFKLIDLECVTIPLLRNPVNYEFDSNLNHNGYIIFPFYPRCHLELILNFRNVGTFTNELCDSQINGIGTHPCHFGNVIYSFSSPPQF